MNTQTQNENLTNANAPTSPNPKRVKANHHEKFKLFQTQGGNYTDVLNFLNRHAVNPKSISISRKANQNDSIVSVGYEETVAQHKFDLITRSIPAGDLLVSEGLIQQAAEQLTGVICQDIVYYDGNLIVTFLTTK